MNYFQKCDIIHVVAELVGCLLQRVFVVFGRRRIRRVVPGVGQIVLGNGDRDMSCVAVGVKFVYGFDDFVLSLLLSPQRKQQMRGLGLLGLDLCFDVVRNAP